MNHHKQKLLQALFAHPISANIDFKDVTHLLAELGGDITDKGDHVAVTLNGKTTSLHRPHQHTMSKDEVARVRDFLSDCGINADAA